MIPNPRKIYSQPELLKYLEKTKAQILERVMAVEVSCAEEYAGSDRQAESLSVDFRGLDRSRGLRFIPTQSKQQKLRAIRNVGPQQNGPATVKLSISCKRSSGAVHYSQIVNPLGLSGSSTADVRICLDQLIFRDSGVKEFPSTSSYCARTVPSVFLTNTRTSSWIAKGRPWRGSNVALKRRFNAIVFQNLFLSF
jgi:hypothetical protein